MRPSFFYVAYLICCAGVNGSSTHAVKALAGALAERDGYGRGEFSYATNHYLLSARRRAPAPAPAAFPLTTCLILHVQGLDHEHARDQHRRVHGAVRRVVRLVRRHGPVDGECLVAAGHLRRAAAAAGGVDDAQ